MKINIRTSDSATIKTMRNLFFLTQVKYRGCIKQKMCKYFNRKIINRFNSKKY